MSLAYGSVCSGIEAATVAWHPLGWQPQFFSEIEAAPRAVLAHHYPKVPLHGDFTTIREGQYGAIDLLVGGTPCQSFSVAGLRGGLADDRGNLALEYLRLAQRLGPRWLVWENVPGVLSSAGGRDFGAILGGLVELGYGFAYRVLDAQYIRVDGFGRAVPQRRRRVFVVGYLGDWRRAAAVLFERACLRGDPAPRREAGAGAAAGTLGGTGPGGGWRVGADEAAAEQLVAARLNGISEYGADIPTLRAKGGDAGGGSEALLAFGGNDTRGPIEVATALSAHGGPHGRMDFESETFIAFQQGGSNIGTTGPVSNTLTKGNGNESGGVPCIAFQANESCAGHFSGEIGLAPTLKSGHGGGSTIPAVALDLRNALRDPDKLDAINRQGCGIGDDVAHTLTAGAEPGVQHGWAVRRLTPRECERLQGFPDDYTLVPHGRGLMADGPRYKALGNSMAVNAMRWIGRRIEAVEALSAASLLQAAE